MPPCVSSSVSCLCLKCIISSILWNKTNFILVYSWKELLWSIIVPIIFSILIWNVIIISYLFNFNFWFYFLNLSWFFTCLNWLLFLIYFLRCDWSFSLFILKLKLLFRIQIRRINRTFDFSLFFLFLNLFLLFFRFRSLLLWTLLLRWRLFFNLFFRFFIFFGNINLWLLFCSLLIILIQILKSFRLLELTYHPSFWLLMNSSWYFRRFWFY